MADPELTWLEAASRDGTYDLALLELAAPQLLVRGPDGEPWGVSDERVAAALAVGLRTLLAQLDLERRRSDQLDRRTRWLYKALTGHELPDTQEAGT